MSSYPDLDAMEAAVQLHPGLSVLDWGTCASVFCVGRVHILDFDLQGVQFAIPSCGHVAWLPWWAWGAKARVRRLFQRAVALRIAHASAVLASKDATT